MLPPGAKRWLVFRHHFKQIESPDALSRLWRGSLLWPRHFFPINIQRLNLLSNHLLRQTFFTADRERRVKDDQILAHKPTGWKGCYVFRGTIHHRPLNHRHNHTVSKISRYEANVSTSTAGLFPSILDFSALLRGGLCQQEEEERCGSSHRPNPKAHA